MSEETSPRKAMLMAIARQIEVFALWEVAPQGEEYSKRQLHEALDKLYLAATNLAMNDEREKEKKNE